LNVTLAGCSSAEPASVSVQLCKIQNSHLYLQPVKILSHLPFYTVSALLIKNGVAATSHSGVRQKFGQLFVQTGLMDRNLAKHFSELFEKRQKGDYNDFFDFDEQTVLDLYEPSVQFIKEIDSLIKIN
jgi:uncharacterized protein (UPF0332 family)